MKIRSHTQLDVYKMSFKVAMILFELSRKFPIEERDTRSQFRYGEHRVRFVLIRQKHSEN